MRGRVGEGKRDWVMGGDAVGGLGHGEEIGAE